MSHATDWAPYGVVIFDCDSTLSTVEGIDELARWAGKEVEVAALTDRAMNGELPLEQVYGRRLDLINATRENVERLAQLYRDTVVTDAREVIAALQAEGRQVYIVSGGLAKGVRDFGVWLGMPEDRIFAVELEYNQLAGNWWETWRHPAGRNLNEQVLAHDGGPLTIGRGKAEIIRRLRGAARERAMLIGDGGSDLEASEAVDLFVGFGGVVARPKVAAAAPVFVREPSLAAILPLALARPEAPRGFEALYDRGASAVADETRVAFRRADLRGAVLRRLRGA
ncbi:MAG TPA: HAD-IB family phosphatase [Anaerolineales bacterium]|nr:HAD-IB family phosphatase [Anaerolineales bacterium]